MSLYDCTDSERSSYALKDIAKALARLADAHERMAAAAELRTSNAEATAAKAMEHMEQLMQKARIL